MPNPETELQERDPQAIAIECAAKYRNVALSGDKYGTGFTTVTIEVSDIYLPDLLEGIAVSRVQLVPLCDKLTLVFTRETDR